MESKNLFTGWHDCDLSEKGVTEARVLPYYITEILPRLMRVERILCAAHGNSLRALVMVLDRHTNKTILDVNLGIGVPMVYHHDRLEARSGGVEQE